MPRFDFVPFEPRNPISVRGGIRARSRTGWVRHQLVVQAMDRRPGGFRPGSSFESRQIVCTSRPGVIDRSGKRHREVPASRVQGVRPYRVTIRIETLDAVHWERLAASLGDRLLLMAELLAGRMPDNIEEIFNEAGLSLLPRPGGLTSRPGARVRTHRTPASMLRPSTFYWERSSIAIRFLSSN